MAGIRGVKNPMPKKGGQPTGIFSSRGSQKRDPLVGDQSKHAKFTATNFDQERKGPASRGKK